MNDYVSTPHPILIRVAGSDLDRLVGFLTASPNGVLAALSHALEAGDGNAATVAVAGLATPATKLEILNRRGPGSPLMRPAEPGIDSALSCLERELRAAVGGWVRVGEYCSG
jgi:hypothetical protein